MTILFSRFQLLKEGSVFSESSPDFTPSPLSAKKKKNSMDDDKFHSRASHKQRENVVSKYASVNEMYGNGHAHRSRGRNIHVETSSTSTEDSSDDSEQNTMSRKRVKEGGRQKSKNPDKDRSEMTEPLQKDSTPLQQETPIDDDAADVRPSDPQVLDQLKEENRELKERLKRKEKEILGGVLNDLQLEREERQSLEIRLQEAERKIEELNKEQKSLIDIFSEERDRRDIEEEN